MIPRSTVPDSVTPVPPFEETAAGLPHASPNPPTDSVPKPDHRRPPDVDPETGRLRPISAEEWQARQEELTRRPRRSTPRTIHRKRFTTNSWRNLDEERRRTRTASGFRRLLLNQAMAQIIVLDSTPLGLACRRGGHSGGDLCRAWLDTLRLAGARLVVPEIADFGSGAS